MSKSLRSALVLSFLGLVTLFASGCASSSEPAPTSSSKSKVEVDGNGNPVEGTPAADPVDVASLKVSVGGGNCLVADNECIVHAGAAGFTIALAAADCGTSLVAAVAVLVCQAAGGPINPLADFCSSGAATISGVEAVKCLAEAFGGAALSQDAAKSCVKSCTAPGEA